MDQRTIVAMGGGGFLDGDLLLDEYILGLTGTSRPRVCFLPTASGDARESILEFYRAFSGQSEPSDLTLFEREVQDLREFLLSQDVIYVGRGNAANMLGVWRVHGVDDILREAWERGIVLCGTSAGASCWFEACVTDSFGPVLAPLHDGLGLLPGSFCPHYDGEAQRRPTYERLVAAGFPAGYALDDSVAIRFIGTELEECVTTKQYACAYWVELIGRDVVHTDLEPCLLGPG